MKKVLIIFLLLLISGLVAFLGFNYKHSLEPNHYYQVYLDDELLGTIKSKKELEKYIDKQNERTKKRYNVDKISKPNGLEIKKVSTYNDELVSIPDIYKTIHEKKAFTIKGYQFTLEREEPLIIYVLDKDVFENAVKKAIETFVGEEKYAAFINNTQEPIKITGSYTNNVYIDEDISVKEVQIPINEKIFTSADDLTSYLIFGEDSKKEIYTVQIGDTIPKIAFNHKISVAEFLIANEMNNKFIKENSLPILYPGLTVTIAETNPQLSVVIEERIVEDVQDKYQIIEEINPNELVGHDKVVQAGENGLSRLTRNTKKINGVFIYSDTEKREILKPTIDEIISKGGKIIPNVGSLTSWGWPTDAGWVLTDDYVWRINPVTGKRELHSGIDISGLGYYASIYATNNGTVETKKYSSDYGNHIVINHNNGYYTLYAHMAAFSTQQVGDTVSRGELIGYMGMTGWATGVHLHYEVWKGCRFCRISPWSIY